MKIRHVALIALMLCVLTGCVSIKPLGPDGKATSEIKVYMPYKYNVQSGEIATDEKALGVMQALGEKTIEVGGAAFASKLAEKASESIGKQQ